MVPTTFRITLYKNVSIYKNTLVCCEFVCWLLRQFAGLRIKTFRNNGYNIIPLKINTQNKIILKIARNNKLILFHRKQFKNKYNF